MSPFLEHRFTRVRIAVVKMLHLIIEHEGSCAVLPIGCMLRCDCLLIAGCIGSGACVSCDNYWCGSDVVSDVSLLWACGWHDVVPGVMLV